METTASSVAAVGVGVAASSASAAETAEEEQQHPKENRLAPFNPTNDEVQLGILSNFELTPRDVLFDFLFTLQTLFKLTNHG